MPGLRDRRAPGAQPLRTTARRVPGRRSAAQLQAVLPAQVFTEVAGKQGMTADQVAAEFAAFLPEFIDSRTTSWPNGAWPWSSRSWLAAPNTLPVEPLPQVTCVPPRITGLRQLPVTSRSFRDHDSSRAAARTAGAAVPRINRDTRASASHRPGRLDLGETGHLALPDPGPHERPSRDHTPEGPARPGRHRGPEVTDDLPQPIMLPADGSTPRPTHTSPVTARSRRHSLTHRPGGLGGA